MIFCIFLTFWILFLYWLFSLSFFFWGIISWFFRWFFSLKFVFGYLEKFQINWIIFLIIVILSSFSGLYSKISRFFVVFYFQKKNLDGISGFFEFWSSRVGTRTVRSRNKTAPKIQRENWNQVLIFGKKKKPELNWNWSFENFSNQIQGSSKNLRIGQHW